MAKKEFVLSKEKARRVGEKYRQTNLRLRKYNKRNKREYITLNEVNEYLEELKKQEGFNVKDFQIMAINRRGEWRTVKAKGSVTVAYGDQYQENTISDYKPNERMFRFVDFLHYAPKDSIFK